MMAHTVSHRNHVLPDFLIIGAQKSGTTSLYGYITQHPEVMRATKKEVHYFDKNYHQGEDWYRSHFPKEDAIGQYPRFITGEATPYYLFHPSCPQRIYGSLPAVKLIVLLRNPVDRAISHYFHTMHRGEEPLSMWSALEEEDRRLSPEIERMQRDSDYQSLAYLRYSYKGRGVYVDQIKRYMKLFPKSQLLILKAEELFDDCARVMPKVYDFLGVNPNYILQNPKTKNIGQYPKDIPESIRTALEEYFSTHNQRLYDYLGRDFGW